MSRPAGAPWYDVGVSHTDRIMVEAAVDSSEAVLRLRIYVGEPASVVSGFLAETGPPALPPPWGIPPLDERQRMEHPGPR